MPFFVVELKNGNEETINSYLDNENNTNSDSLFSVYWLPIVLFSVSSK